MSETVQDRRYVTVIQAQEVEYGFFIGTEIDDLKCP